jgi:hypothetical protein
MEKLHQMVASVMYNKDLKYMMLEQKYATAYRSLTTNNN